MKISKLGHALQKNRHKLTKDVVYGVNKALGASEAELSEIAKITKLEFSDQVKKARILLGESGKPLNAIENIPIKNEVTEAVSASEKAASTISKKDFIKEAQAGLNIETRAGATNKEARSVFNQMYNDGITSPEEAVKRFPEYRATATVVQESPAVEIPKTNNINNARKFKESYARLGASGNEDMQKELRPQIKAYLQNNPDATVDEIVASVGSTSAPAAPVVNTAPKSAPSVGVPIAPNAGQTPSVNTAQGSPRVNMGGPYTQNPQTLPVPLAGSGGGGASVPPSNKQLMISPNPSPRNNARSTMADSNVIDKANEEAGWGIKHAIGIAVSGSALAMALSSSRGQQNNAQLYGQQPLY